MRRLPIALAILVGPFLYQCGANRPPTCPPCPEPPEPPDVDVSDARSQREPPPRSGHDAEPASEPVILAYRETPSDRAAPRHVVVRAQEPPSAPEEADDPPASPRREVILRQELRWLDLLRGVALSLDRSQSAVLAAFLRHPLAPPGDLGAADLESQIRRDDRGQPFADGQATANRVIGIREHPPGDPLADSFLQLQTGRWADQAYFLEERDIATLERLARDWDATPGQVADILISREARRLWSAGPRRP